MVYFSSTVGMDSQVKEIIPNCTLKSYKITPIESANVLRVTMKFYGVSNTSDPGRGGGTSSGSRNSWPSLGEILFWCQSPSWSLVNPLPLPPWVDQFQRPLSLPSPQQWRSWWLKSRRCIRSIST